MSKIGQPISDEARRSKTLKHLILYGMKMMVRADLGGKEVKNIPQYLAGKFNGKTAMEAGIIASDFLNSNLDGVRSRQSRTIEEIERRGEDLRSSLIESYEHYKAGDYKRACGIIAHSVARTLNGEDENDPFPAVDAVVHVRVSPSEHILN